MNMNMKLEGGGHFFNLSIQVWQPKRRSRGRDRGCIKITLKILPLSKTYILPDIFVQNNQCKVIELDDGGSHTFKERNEDMGSWQVGNPKFQC